MANRTFWAIPHTHWEGAVFKTRAEYLEMGLAHILHALRLLKCQPGFRFTLDQVCYVKPFLERYPQERAAFQEFVNQGRLAIAGGTDVMLDVNMPGGESFVRQVLYGKRYFRESLGVDVTTGWQLDTFGHHAQMPQLLRLAGYRSFWFFRGVPEWETPAEFLWEGLDGSRIPAFWLAHGYAVTYGSPAALPEFAAFFRGRYEMLEPFARGGDRVGLGGADVCPPEEHLAPLAEAFNQDPEAPFALRLSVPAEYEDAAAGRPDLPVFRGELNPIFQGTYSSRIELKQQNRENERLLLTAEKLGVLLRWLGQPADDAVLERAWEPTLFNQAHDLMSGVMTDLVYEDTLRGYAFSARLAGEELAARLRALASQVDTQGEGIPLLVFNPLGWPRTDLVVARVGFSEAGAPGAGPVPRIGPTGQTGRMGQTGLAEGPTPQEGLALLDPEGRPVPVQLLEARRDGAGALLEAVVAFVAREVPALGHCVYRVLGSMGSVGGMGSAAPDSPYSPYSPHSPTAVLETDHYRVAVDAGGAITEVLVKDGGWQALSGPGNVVVQEPDHGDFWEPYRPLDGGSRIAMKEPHPIPPAGGALFSTEQRAEGGHAVAGPVLSEFTVERPFGERGRLRTRVRVIAGLSRIEVRTSLVNQEEFVRCRVVFPTAVEGGRATHEIPFGAVDRPAGIEFPAQHWVDTSDGRRGLALLNRGLPGNNVVEDALVLSLMRSTAIVAYGFGGGYEPGMTSHTGLELGKELTFDYALVPHAGDWRQAGITRDGLEFNHPLLALLAAPHPGALPARWGFLEVAPANVVVSALKAGPDGTAILRLYEAAGEPVAGGSLRFAADLLSVEQVGRMEDAGEPVPAEGNVVSFDLGAFEIRTLKLRFAA